MSISSIIKLLGLIAFELFNSSSSDLAAMFNIKDLIQGKYFDKYIYNFNFIGNRHENYKF